MDFFDTVCIYGNIGDAIINVADAIVYNKLPMFYNVNA